MVSVVDFPFEQFNSLITKIFFETLLQTVKGEINLYPFLNREMTFTLI